MPAVPSRRSAVGSRRSYQPLELRSLRMGVGGRSARLVSVSRQRPGWDQLANVFNKKELSVAWAVHLVHKRKGHPATGRPFLLGRIVPTEAKPSELSGEIVWSAKRGVKAKSGTCLSYWW